MFLFQLAKYKISEYGVNLKKEWLWEHVSKAFESCMACLYVWCILAILDRSDFVNTQNASKPLGKSHAKSVQSPYRVTSRKSTSQLKLLVSFNNHDQFNQRFTQEVKKQPAKYEKIFLCSILVLLGSPQWYLVAICIERCGLSQIEWGACLSESCLSKMIQLPWFFWTLLVQDNIYFSDLGGGYLIICFFVCLPFCLVICPHLFIGHRYPLICSIFRAPLLFQEVWCLSAFSGCGPWSLGTWAEGRPRLVS